MDDNARPHTTAHLVDEFLERPYRACLERSEEGNFSSQTSSKNHPRPENSMAKRVAPITTVTYFQYKITM
ncbi:hypothetical protein TNCV_574941 [Trichonephila clavipes]|nr:hypothetical protein TNCV_574941 [Trichonephila clavipes]